MKAIAIAFPTVDACCPPIWTWPVPFGAKFILPSAPSVIVIVPEFVQKEFEEKKIFYKSCRILDGKSEKIKIKKGYAFLKKELGEEGVVQRAAEEIINSII